MRLAHAVALSSLVALSTACGSDGDAEGSSGSGGGSGSSGAAGASGGAGASGSGGVAEPGNDIDPEWPDDTPLPDELDFPPWVTMPEPRRLVVSWRTVAPTTGAVAFGESEILDRQARSDELGELHHVDLGVLKPATAYFYEVRIDGSDATRPGVFVTPGRDAFRFAHFGETHAPGQAANFALFADTMRRFRPHLLVESGDMVDDGNELDHWRSYFRTSAPWISNLIILPAGSNHVDGPGGNANLKELFVLPNNERWYSTRYGQLQVLTLDSTHDLVNFDILTDEPPWVAEQAALAHDGSDDPTFLVGAWHFPACSSLQKNRASDRVWVMNNFIRGFEENGGIDLVLVGHDKYYERSEIAGGIPHVMTNAGLISPSDEVGNNHPDCTEIVTVADTRSVGLVTVNGTQLSLEIVGEDDAPLDELTIEK